MADRLTLYTVIAGFWCAFLVILGVNFAGNLAMTGSILPHEAHMEKFGFPIEAVEEEHGPAEAAGGQQRPDIKPMIVAAKPETGADVFRKCASCHTADAGGKNMVGPNLHNAIGREIAHVADFKYSDSLKAIGGNWSYDKIDDYLENPKRLAPRGTMSFAGLKKPADRAAVIKFLMTKTDNPPAIEVSATAEAPAEAAKP